MNLKTNSITVSGVDLVNGTPVRASRSGLVRCCGRRSTGGKLLTRELVVRCMRAAPPEVVMRRVYAVCTLRPFSSYGATSRVAEYGPRSRVASYNCSRLIDFAQSSKNVIALYGWHVTFEPHLLTARGRRGRV